MENQSPVNIGVNLLPVIPGVGGVETYVRSFINGVRRLDIEVDFTIYVNKESRDTFDFPSQFQVFESPVPASNRPIRYLWEQVVLPLHLWKHEVDVLFCPGVMTPIFSPVPSVITIHDANFSRVPETFSAFKREVISRTYPLSAKTASKIITVSEFSKNEIVEHIDVPEEKVRTVYNPLPTNLSPPGAGSEYTIEQPYLLSVGKDYEHKNLETPIRALSELPEQIHLIFAGFDAPSNHPLRDRVQELGVQERVHFAGYVSQEELASLYSNASIYVHPSRYEGFGFPLIEAMYYGAPVVSSNAASLPEVGGDAARYFDPDSTEELVRLIQEIFGSEGLRRKMIREGEQNIDRFSSCMFVKEIIDICRSAVGERQ